MFTKEEVVFHPRPVNLISGDRQKLLGGVIVKTPSHIGQLTNGNIDTHFGNKDVIVKKSRDIITKSGACIKYVCSKVTVYHSSRIELKWRRALHYCDLCKYGDDKTPNSICGAIHHGICMPVVGKSSFQSSVSGKPRQNATIITPGRNHPPKSGHITQSTSNLPSQTVLQTISNGTVTTKERDVRDREEKENANNNFQINNNNLTQTLDTNSNSIKESRSKKRGNSKWNKTVIKCADIPSFYFPHGRPPDKDDTEEVLLRVSQEFSKFEEGKATIQQMPVIAKTCGLPLYWKCPLFMASGGAKQGFITYQMFSAMWKRLNQTCHDRAAQFVTLIAKQGTNYLESEDLVPLIQDVVDTHPGLTFLLEAPEFHSRYVNTVIARIFYCVNRSWTGRITIQELRKSSLLRTIALLEDEDDINQIMDFFSYEHFYVIYCKFWELDKDHDLYIDRTDLARHNEHAISTRMIDRIFSGAVTRGKTFEDGKMSYPEFVWFLLSEEDKKHPTSVEYWFRCMDIDGDGVISMFEMEYFYEEQMQKMEALGIERLPFEDCLCQMLDMVQPEFPLKITLKDLKRCKMTNIFYDTFMNLDKFLEHEQRDPFANLRDLENDAPEPSDWEKYAAEEYEILVAEEGANDQEEIHYEDDFEPEEDEMSHEDPLIGGDVRPSDPIQRSALGNSNKGNIRSINDDLYDFKKAGSSY